MTSTLLAVAAAYVALGVLLLTLGLASRVAWWGKAAAIVVTSAFFVEAFFSTRSLLGFPRAGQLPPRFQLLWVRVVEPDVKAGDPGAIYLWIEAIDENNVPDGVPLSSRLDPARSRPVAGAAAGTAGGIRLHARSAPSPQGSVRKETPCARCFLCLL